MPFGIACAMLGRSVEASWHSGNRSFESQTVRASALNLVTAAIVLWNTAYLGRALDAPRLRRTNWPRRTRRALAARLGTHQHYWYVWEDEPSLGSNGFRPFAVPT